MRGHRSPFFGIWNLVRVTVLPIATLTALVFIAREMRELLTTGNLVWLPVVSHAWLGLSLVIAASSVAIAGFAFALCFRSTQDSRLVPLYAASQVAKYVPGKVWNVVIQRLVLHRETDWPTVLKANLFVFGLICAAQIASALAALSLLHRSVFALVILPVVTAAVPMLARSVLSSLERRGLSPRLLPDRLTSHDWKLGLMLVLLSISSFLAWLTFYAGALGLSRDESASLVFVSLVAWLGGLLSILPAGLGVREAVFMATQSDFLVTPQPPMLAALALASRMWLLAVDAICAFVGACILVYLRRSRR